MRIRALAHVPREVGVLTAVAFAVAVGFGIVVPALPLFARNFDVGTAAASAVISAFALARLLFGFASGRLVDRFGERLVMASGIGIVAVSSALAGLAQNYPQLVALRGIGGVGSAMFSVSAYGLLLRSVDASRRGRATGMFSGGFLLGGITGPALGGWVTGVSVRLPFFLYAGTLLVAGGIGLFFLRERGPVPGGTAAVAEPAGPLGAAATRNAPEPADEAPMSVPAALRLPAYRAALLVNLADSWAVLGVRSALIPLFVVDVLHRDSTWTGVGLMTLAAVNAATLWPAGRVSDGRGRRPVLVTGCLASAAALLVIATAENLTGFLCGMALFGLGSGMLDVAPGAIVGDIIGRRGGRVVAAYQMAGDAGVIVGPLVAGWLAERTSFGWAFALTSCVLMLGAVAGLRAGETRA